MPRTKAPRKKPAEKINKFAQQVLPFLEANRKNLKDQLEKEIDGFKRKLQMDLIKSKYSIPKNVSNKTIGELMDLPMNWSGSSISVSTIHVLDVTKALTEKKKRIRSSSCGDDEGYLTTESTKSTSGRQSRTRSRLQKTKRVSRSLSTRTKGISDKYKTPANRIPSNTYGTVTPKMKPNTPQVLLRRPKMGEVALSLQGSPLLTGAVVTDNVANINIPLDDGRLLSIQPERGLRISQIPNLDINTRRQLETLRDNLNKVCSLSAIR